MRILIVLALMLSPMLDSYSQDSLLSGIDHKSNRLLVNSDFLQHLGLLIPMYSETIFIDTNKTKAYKIEIRDREENLKLPGANMQILPGAFSVDTITLSADENGKFISSLFQQTQSFIAIVSHIGYETKKFEFNLLLKPPKPVIYLSKKDSRQQEIFIISPSIRRISCGFRCYMTCIEITKHSIETREKYQPAFMIFPNPVRNQQTLKLRFNRLLNGEVRLISSIGSIIDRKIINEKISSIDYLLPNIASGVYFIRFFDTSSRKTFTEKLIVQ